MHAVSSGLDFLRRMIDHSKSIRALHHKVKLNVGFCSDLMW